MKHELRVMLSQRHGSIINVSSTYGQTGAAGASIYAASKHAVVGLTQSAALEAAESGVRVNAVAPGPIDTGMLTRFTGTEERKSRLALDCTAQTLREARRDRPDHRVSLIRQGGLHHWRDFRRRRRQNGAIGIFGLRFTNE